MGSHDMAEQAANLREVASAAGRANLWCLLVGDNHAASPVYGNVFQPVPTIARLSAVTGSMAVGMVVLAPFYHPCSSPSRSAPSAPLSTRRGS
jgi:alkanesulfonate monooxygenase SsuD/methylene tetrahydromethanopterin reductase-like flavin-dependent oxidoreductase (luciferase family)